MVRSFPAGHSGLPSPEGVRNRLAEVEAARKPERIDLKGMFDLFEPNPTWPEGTKILTEIHAPVNLLKDEK